MRRLSKSLDRKSNRWCAMLGWILIDVVIEMKAHPWHCCFTIPLEVYTLCRRNTVLTFSRNSGSIRSFRQFHYLARTTRFQTLQQRQLSYQSAWLQPNAFDKSYGSRQATTSQKNPVTFFDSNLKARESQADIEKSWLKAHLNSLPSREDLPDTAKPEKQEAANDAILRERYARSVQANARLTLDDEPPRYSMDNHSPAYRDLIIRCTTFDAEGNIQKHSEPVAKNALCAQHNLQPRDLRKIDSRIPNVIPTILVRKEAILLNMLHIRMLIKSNVVILVDAIGTTDSALLQAFQKDLSASLRAGYRGSGGLPYEFRALEAALSSVSNALEEEWNVHRDAVDKLIGPLESHIVPSELRKLLQYSRQLSVFQKRAKSVQAAIDEVLEQDDDMSSMYLSEAYLKPREHDDHQEVEMLLESFSKQVEEIVNEVDTLVSNVHQTQDVIELILDSSRNSLLTLDLQASIATMGLASGAFIAGLFGMNLHSSLESTPYAFWITSGLAFTLVCAVTVGGLRRVYRLRRIGLGQGVFGDYHSAWPGHTLSDGYGRKALYYERTRRKRQEKQERETAKAALRHGRYR